MDINKNKNKSISNRLDNNNFSNNNIFNFPISINGHQCIGPCYPPNNLFYHPIYLTSLMELEEPICPTFKYFNDKEGTYDKIDQCRPEDITENFEKFELFEDTFQFASNEKFFLSQIYDINNLNGATEFLEESLELLPVYSQKRILNCIYSVWNGNKNFPTDLFCTKIKYLLKTIYHIDLSIEKIKNKIIDSKIYNDIFDYFEKKYSKKRK